MSAYYVGISSVLVNSERYLFFPFFYLKFFSSLLLTISNCGVQEKIIIGKNDILIIYVYPRLITNIKDLLP